MAWVPALILPILFWQQGTDAASDLRKAGVTHLAVPPADVAKWQSTGLTAEPLDVASTVNLAAPGVALRMDEASATHVPWVSCNGWRFIRESDATFYYDNPADASLAAAEAFAFGGRAIIRPAANGITPFAKMLEFLQSINSDQTGPIADIAFVDDKSARSGEVMNLMVRDNLLFKIAPSGGAGTKLTVQLGSEEYPPGRENDADSLVHKIRANLTDAKRSVRVFGTSVVIVRLTGNADNPRLHLLNYGAPAHIRMGAFRVRVLGRFSKARFHCFAAPDAQLADFEAQADATEFTVPSLTTYAVVDLAR
jgi:hypothetical protein